MMEQTERIAAMEQALDEAAAAVRALSDTLEQYAAAQPALRALEAYYTGPDWLRDLEADAAGRLPQDLKRGVLSEDAVYDLLADNDRVLAALCDIMRKNGKRPRQTI